MDADESTLGLAGPRDRAEVGLEGNLPGLQVGEQLAGRFVVLRFVARGGMGAVYEAKDVMLDARVALKVLEGRLSADAEAMARLQREVLLARRVSHPNVCRVYEFYRSTQENGLPIYFLTMEYLEGETLAARVARGGRFSTAEALPLVKEMCEGLTAAHAEGVLHRDFKSSNVMLVQRASGPRATSATGVRVAITDFGIARILNRSPSEMGGGGLTGGASLLGTPEYMAPEQVTGGAVSRATDVYALGVVLYEMMTGVLPFSRGTASEIAARRLHERPPAPKLSAPGLDPRWSRVILRCLERDSGRRFQSAGEVSAALSGRGRARRWLAAGGLALVAASLAAGARLAHLPDTAGPTQAAAGAAQPSIAVLPFVDMSPEHDQEYFSDGLAQEIIAALSRQSSVHVAARSSSFSFKGKNEDLRTVGQKLNVANVLEGSVRKAGSHLRVTAQLVNATSGYELWSRTFDRELTDVFAVQDEIAQAVVSVLNSRVLSTNEAANHQPTSPEAYNHYLHGLQLENLGSMSALEEAIEQYRRAVALDTSYAPAHARLAWALWYYGEMQSSWTVDARTSNAADALREANRAIELEPAGGDGYVSRGLLRAFSTSDWDWLGSRQDLEKAVNLSPGDARARAWYGTILATLGQVPEAVAAGRIALELDPLSPEAHLQLARFYNAEGKHAQARELLKKTVEIAPQNARALAELGFTELLDGNPTEALAHFQKHDQAWVRDFGNALAHYSLGNAQQSQSALDHLIANYADVRYQIAQVHAWRGERDLAFAALELARHEHDAGLYQLKWDPIMRPLRTDPRFRSLLESVKLPID